MLIGSILDEETLLDTRDRISELGWRDGRDTAGRTAKRVKNNLQADLSTREGRALSDRLLSHIRTHPVFAAAARPKAFSKLIVSRTENGGGYGDHVDNALMGTGADRLRTDLSFTLFLSDPTQYEGGALEIDTLLGRQSFRPAAGDLVLYPSTSIHRVTPVTSGTRLAAVGWVQSLVRDPSAREVLFDLENLQAHLRARLAPDDPGLLTTAKITSNLIRRWSDL